MRIPALSLWMCGGGFRWGELLNFKNWGSELRKLVQILEKLLFMIPLVFAVRIWVWSVEMI